MTGLLAQLVSDESPLWDHDLDLVPWKLEQTTVAYPMSQATSKTRSYASKINNSFFTFSLPDSYRILTLP